MVQHNIVNPNLSICSSSSIFETYSSSRLDDQSTHHADMGQKEDSQISDNNNKDNEIDSSFRPLRRRTMVITKCHVMLNDLLLKHKASLLLYDEIIDLFSSYILSPNFNT